MRTHHKPGWSTLWLSLLALWFLVCPTRPLLAQAGTTPVQRLSQAIDAYQHGGYLEAAAELTALLYPLKLTNRQDIVKAKVHLGLCYYVLGRKDESAQEFRDVFRIDPNYQPDPLYIAPEMIQFIERLRPPPPEVKRNPPVPGLGEQLSNTAFRPVQFNPGNLIPLGIPQFRHGDIKRGAALAGTELALLSVNVGSYWYLRYYNNTEQAEELYPYLVAARAANITTFTLLLVTISVGAGDAMYRYRNPPTSSSSLHFLPMVGPNMAGLGIAGHF